MAETRQQTSSKDVGNVTNIYSSKQPAHGASDALVANLKTNQDDFFADLDALINTRPQDGCTIGRLVKSLDKSLQIKINEIMLNPTVQSARLAEVFVKYGLPVTSSDVLRRHRRRMIGKEGCKCPIES